MTKLELEAKVKQLTAQLEAERSRPTGHTIRDVSVTMSDPDPTKIAVAEAVKAGMLALQTLGGESYGIYLASNKDG